MTISDIVNSIYFRTKTNSSSFSAANMLIFINKAYDHVVSLILKADATWQWDDDNQTDLPIATAALVSGQQDYALAASHLTIDRIETKDQSEKWHLLQPIDRKEVTTEALSAYRSVNGLPEEYDLIGRSIFLYPAPNFSQSASLKIYFQRGPAKFTSAEVTTGTKEPGFVSLFHDLVSLWVSYDYAIANGLKTANGFMVEIQNQENKLDAFYGRRDRDVVPRFTTTYGGSQGHQSGVIGSGYSDSNK